MDASTSRGYKQPLKSCAGRQLVHADLVDSSPCGVERSLFFWFPRSECSLFDSSKWLLCKRIYRSPRELIYSSKFSAKKSATIEGHPRKQNLGTAMFEKESLPWVTTK